VRALARIDSPVIFPIHPRTKNFIEQYGLHDSLKDSNVRLSQPLGYLDFIKLVKHSRKLITDSGGAQKEAYALRVPCITLRETEWVETVKEGWNRLVEVEEEAILEAVQNFEPPQRQRNFLGDGDAYVKIANTINEL